MTLCFIPGYRSEFQTSRKSQLIYDIACEEGYGYIAWDHRPDESVQQWFEDSCHLLASTTQGPLYIVGASMGTWLALLIASRSTKTMAGRVCGILGVGAGVDFTEHWLQHEVPWEHRDDREYVLRRPSAYDPSGYYAIPVRTLLDSRPVLMLPNDRQHQWPPIHLIHGRQDQDVPIKRVQALYQFLRRNGGDKVKLEIIDDGDHRLSRETDLLLIKQRVHESINTLFGNSQ